MAFVSLTIHDKCIELGKYTTYLHGNIYKNVNITYIYVFVGVLHYKWTYTVNIYMWQNSYAATIFNKIIIIFERLVCKNKP